MKYLFLILLFLVACERPATMVGNKSRYKDWKCIKYETKINPGMTFNGDFTMVADEDCLVTKCFLFEKTLGKTFLSDQIDRIKLLPDEECI